MTLADFQTLISNTLSNQEEIIHILNSDTSLLVNCTDGSNFFINILESKQTFIHDDYAEKYVNEYMTTHSKEDFAQDILNLASHHSVFLLYFMIFTKLEEMGVIDRGLLYHLIDNIIHYENEIDEFTARLMSHLKLNGNRSD